MRLSIRLSAISLLFVMLALVLSGCEATPEGVWLCSIKTDGTGFQKILKNEYEWTNWQRWNDLIRVYPAANGKLILMYSDGLKVYDQATQQQTIVFRGKHDWHIVWSDSGYYMKRYANIALSSDGTMAYYTVDGALTALDLTTYQTTILYDNPYHVYYPILDETGTKIVMQGEVASPSPEAVILTYHLGTSSVDVVHSTLAHKASLANGLGKYIYSLNHHIKTMDLDGGAISTLYTAPDTTLANDEPYLFIPFADGSRVITTDDLWNGNLLILNTQDGSTQSIGWYNNTYSFSDLANQTVDIDHSGESINFVSNRRIQRYNILSRSTFTVLSPEDANSPDSYLWLGNGFDDNRIFFIGDFGSSIVKSVTKPAEKGEY